MVDYYVYREVDDDWEGLMNWVKSRLEEKLFDFFCIGAGFVDRFWTFYFDGSGNSDIMKFDLF